MVSSILKTVATMALGMPSIAFALLDKPALWPNYGVIGAGLDQILPAHSYQVSAFLDGYIATECLNEARGNGNNFDPWDITTYLVKFDDCAVEWLMCRHKDAAISLESYLYYWSKVPVHMRQGVKATLLLPGGTSAYAYGDMVVIYGAPDGVGLFLHETTHTLDFGGAYASGFWLSDRPEWSNAYNADSAVPDDYARTNLVEDLAQHSGPILFDRFVSGGVNGALPDYWRIANQQGTLASQGDNGPFGSVYQIYNIQCTTRRDNGGWQALPPRKRSAPAERRTPLDKRSPLVSRDFYPNTANEQKAYVESKGVAFVSDSDVKAARLGGALTRTNCTAYS